ncbi:uncharacterized protein [Dermacentor albipictus]|uniref:uncharacterized protein n=1 Tax=Dermacentor albipictus TaxID=60249 RepID=UPI0038FD1E87
MQPAINPFLFLVQQSLECGVLPNDWMSEKVVPTPKQGLAWLPGCCLRALRDLDRPQRLLLRPRLRLRPRLLDRRLPAMVPPSPVDSPFAKETDDECLSLDQLRWSSPRGCGE